MILRSGSDSNPFIMKIRYLLKRRGPRSGTQPIYLALYQGDETEIIFTGQRIAPKDWNKKERLPKDHTGDIYKAIEQVKSDVQKVIRRMEADEVSLTPFTVKQEYTRRQREKQAAQSARDKKAKLGLMTLSSLIAKYLEQGIYQYKHSTQKAVTESLNQFLRYLKKKGMLTLEKKDLDQDIVNDYERSLIGKLADSTVGKRMKHLRWFLQYNGIELKIKLRDFKRKVISLTQDELTALEKVDVSERVEWQKAKDMFLLGCYTGLRISDLKRLNPVNTQEGVIDMTLIKNGKRVKIPIIAEAGAILSRYGYKAPKISEQAVNESIKDVCKLAGIKKQEERESKRAGQLITQTVPKYELISSHIAGKTFITLAPERWGLEPAEIAGIVGKDVKTLLNHYFGDQGERGRQKILAIENTRKLAAS